MRDSIVNRVCVAMGAMSYVAEQVADVANEKPLPEGLRETVQAVVENYNFNVGLLVEWAEKASNDDGLVHVPFVTQAELIRQVDAKKGRP